MTEPRLRPEDHRAWEAWRLTALRHARTAAHARAVDGARRATSVMLERAPDAAVMWSGGKDSTALTHLVCVEIGAKLRVYSEKDDLDFPGEETYVADLAGAWGLDLEILRPAVSPRQWMAEHVAEIEVGSDLHSRAAGLSKACFYDLVEAASGRHKGVLLGLRAQESRERWLDRTRHFVEDTDGGVVRDVYQYRAGKHAGRWRCTPLGAWSGVDVMAYLVARDIPVLPVYRCIAFMHASDPSRIRKSWWVPGGGNARHGGVAWLRHYWPSLFAQLCSWLPSSRSVT